MDTDKDEVDPDAGAEVVQLPDGRPARVTVSTDLFAGMMNILEQLPYGQVADLMNAVRGDVSPAGS